MPATQTRQTPAVNKESAKAFLRMAGSGQVRDAYARYVDEKFVHHNPYFEAGRDSLLRAMEENAKQNPKKRIEHLRAVAEGDLVAVHSRVRHAPDGSWVPVIHLFRFEDGRIVELWDVGQELPEDSPNRDGPF